MPKIKEVRRVKKYDLIIFDLDGTLLDTSEGIYNSVRYTEKSLGFKPIPNERLKDFVGPPPKKMYMSVYGVTEETALMAVQKHREYGRIKAIYEAKPYPDIKSVLSNLKKTGYKLAVATLKLQGIAESMLKLNGLLDYFDVVIGMDDRESLTKADTIKYAMKKVAVYDNKKTVLIGDSEYDYIGAKEVDINFIAAMYGFGADVFEKMNIKKIECIKELELSLP